MTAATENGTKPRASVQVQPVVIHDIPDLSIHIRTAREFPRSVDTFVKRLKAEACMSPEIAASMTYAKPQAGTKIVGPSARFAETVARTWGNLRVQSQWGEVSGKTVRAIGTAWDLESNTAFQAEVARSIIGKGGKRYAQHMIVTTGMAGQSIARRTVILAAVPSALWKLAWTEAQALATGGGDEKSTAQRIKAELAAWSELGVKQAEALALVEAKGPGDLIGERLFTLSALRTSIEENEVTLEQVLGRSDAGDTSDGAASLNEHLESLEVE